MCVGLKAGAHDLLMMGGYMTTRSHFQSQPREPKPDFLNACNCIADDDDETDRRPDGHNDLSAGL